MNRRPSLRLRLYAAAIAVVIVAMAASWIGLTALFGRHLDRRVGQELDTHLQQLGGAVEFGEDGRLVLLREPADPRFARVFGGLYWQVADLTSGGVMVSRSLWDQRLPPPQNVPEPGGVHVHDIAGPDGASLMAHERAIIVPHRGKQDHSILLTAAIDRAELDELRSGFGRDLAPALLLLGFVLLAGFAFQVEAGLRPLLPLREAVREVKSGRTRRLEAAVPAEIGPLADEIDALLESREAEMARARDRAADLAHGLKTPLAALASDVARLRQRGENDIAGGIEEVADGMRRHVERELVRARIRHGAAAPTPVAPVAEAVARTLARTPSGDGKAFDLDLDPEFTLAIDPDDLGELLGNLMENALRHARGVVRVSAARDEREARLSVEDDGQGMDEAAAETALARGGRLDMRGSAGLGLAIVGDIATANGGELRLGRSPLGGLLAQFCLPRG